MRTLQRAPKPIDMRLTAAPGDAVVFETPKARLGDIEVHFTGRLSVKRQGDPGRRGGAGEGAARVGQHPRARSREGDAPGAGAHGHPPPHRARDRRRDARRSTSRRASPGCRRSPSPVASAASAISTFRHRERGRAEREEERGRSASTRPRGSRPRRPSRASPRRPAAGDAAVGAFTWGGDQARFEDTHKVKGGKEIERSGSARAVGLDQADRARLPGLRQEPCVPEAARAARRVLPADARLLRRRPEGGRPLRQARAQGQAWG